MPLTEKDKKRIEEEEAYRSKIREEHQYSKGASNQTQVKSKDSGVGSGCLIIFVGIFILLALSLML